MIEVEGPDGAVNEFPDGTPDAVIQKALRGVYGIPEKTAAEPVSAAPAAGAPAPSVADRVGTSVRGALGLDTPAEPAAPAAPTPPQRRSSLLGGVADMAGRGVAEGAMNLLGLPVDLVTGALNIGARATGLPTIKRPLFGSDYNKGALNTLNDLTAGALGVEKPIQEPQGLAERLVNRTGQEIGAAAVPVGAGVQAGAALGQAGAKRLPEIARMFAEPAAINAGKFVQREIGLAGAAGAAAGAAREIPRAAGYDEHSIPTTLADLLGAGVGYAGAATLGHVGSKLNDVAQAVRGGEKFANQVSKDSAVDLIAEAAGLPSARLGSKAPTDTSSLVDDIARGRSTADAVPGYQDTLADRTGNTGLAGLEYSRQTNGSAAFAQRNRDNAQAADNAFQEAAPQATPGALRSELEAQRGNVLQDAAQGRQGAQQRFEDAATALQTQMQQDARGSGIRASLDDALGRARDVEREAWSGVSTGEADIRPLVDEFARVRSGLPQATRDLFEPSGLTAIPSRFLPAEAEAGAGAATRASALDGLAPEERAMAERLLGGGEPAAAAGAPPAPANVPIREAVAVRGALTDAQRAAASAGETQRAQVIGQYVDAIDGYFAQHHPNVEAYDQARAVSRDLNDRFTRPQTDVAQTLKRTQGVPQERDTAIPGKFVRPDTGSQDGFNALVREAGTDPRAMNALQDQIRQEVGALRGPEQVDAYVASHSRAFEQFPELRAQVEQFAGAGREAAGEVRREAEITGRLGTPDRAGTSAVGRYLKYGDEQSTTAMRGVLNAPKPAEAVDELLNFAGNRPEAVEGARRTFWDILEGQGRSRGETTASLDGVQPWMPRKVLRFLDDPKNAAVAERLYRDDPEQLGRVREIAEALGSANLRVSAKPPNSSGTAMGVQNAKEGFAGTGLSIEALNSRFYAYRRGQVSGNFLVTSIAASAARRVVAKRQAEAIQRMVDEALVNPEFAKTLLTENNPANRAVLMRSAKGLLGAQASNLLQPLVDDEDEEDPDPVKAAIARRKN